MTQSFPKGHNIADSLLPGLVVIMVFEITVAVMQFRNLSKLILTSEANITVWGEKAILQLLCERGYKTR